MSRSASAVLFLSFFISLSATLAHAAPTARFVATPLQGATCVAPCAVHFDAIGNSTNQTVDASFARPFHTLVFEWNFGDPNAGTWPVSGLSRNRALGAIAGHIYEAPGTYAVTLAVTNPAGQSSTMVQNVVVADPNSAFSATNSYCIANSGTPGGAGFEACPVQLASQHRVIAATVANGFDQAIAACGAATRKTRCLFRAGDSFRASGFPSLAGASGAGLVSRFGSGANPRVTGGNGFLSVQAGWTVAHFDVDLSGTESLFSVGNTQSGITVDDVRGRNVAGSCFVTQTGSAATQNDRIGIFSVDCQLRSSSTSTAVFLRSERTLVYGNVIDNAYAGQFNLRTVHFPHSVISNNRLVRPQEDSTRRNNLQLRSWSASLNGGSLGGPTPAKTEYVIVSDNVMGQDNADHFVRTCETNDCTNSSTAQGLENVIFERNFAYRTTGGAGGNNRVARAFWLQGGDITVRDNVIDLQGAATTPVYSPDVLVDHQANMSLAPALDDDRIDVFNNTVYYDDRSTNGYQFCRGGAVGTGHSCRNNLAWLPNQSGARRIDDGGAWSSANNLYAGTSPFAAAVPQQGLSTMASFQLDPRGPAADAGFDFGASSPSVELDAANRCRPADGGDTDAIAHWDVGAYEANASLGCRRIP